MLLILVQFFIIIFETTKMDADPVLLDGDKDDVAMNVIFSISSRN